MADTGAQLDLFQMDHVLQAYEGGSVVDNNELYEHVRAAAGVSQQVMEARQPIGASGQHHSVAKRRVRWMQQTARRLGLLERVPERRGAWRLTEEGKRRTGKAAPGVALLAFSTDLGLAIWVAGNRYSSPRREDSSLPNEPAISATKTAGVWQSANPSLR